VAAKDAKYAKYASYLGVRRTRINLVVFVSFVAESSLSRTVFVADPLDTIHEEQQWRDS
jgi:hypothetical protein